MEGGLASVKGVTDVHPGQNKIQQTNKQTENVDAQDFPKVGRIIYVPPLAVEFTVPVDTCPVFWF